jgi:hypothetical protein
MAGNPNVNVEQPEQPRAENVDYTRSLKDLFTPIATNSASCIVLPPPNAIHFDLKPHVIQLLPSFHGLDLENPYSHVKKFKDISTTFKFQKLFLRNLCTLDFFPSHFKTEPRHGWIQTCLGLLHLGITC